MTHNQIVFNKVFVDAVSATASFNSDGVDISSVRSYAVQVNWTGVTSASAETINIQASLDEDNWITVATNSFSTTAGSYLLNVEFPAYPFVRLNYVRAAGDAGTITALICGKI